MNKVLPRRRSLLLPLFALTVGILAVIFLLRSGPRAMPLKCGKLLQSPQELPLMQLTDTEGASFGRAALLGHPSLMFFGDVACMNARPATLTTLHEVLLQAQMSNLRVLLITPDRGRDTSAQLKVHLRDFGPAFIGLYASREAIAPLVESLGANWALQESPGCANVSVGPATLYLVDSRAHLTAVFKPPYSSAALQDDLHTLAARSML